MKTKFIEQRQPTNEERKRGAQVVFVREEIASGKKINVLAAKCYESWEQWGAQREVLSENCSTVEAWRNSI